MSTVRYSLKQLLSEWENDCELLKPTQYQRRMEVLDRIDACFPDDLERVSDELVCRQSELIEKLQAVNAQLADSIRFEIREGHCPEIFLEFLRPRAASEPVLPGLSYDYLDDLLSEVFRFESPTEEPLALGTEAIFYQPTPTRHIFELIRAAGITRDDTLIDLGSGLGHVPLLVSICTGATTIGIELDPGWVGVARKCAESLRLRNVAFLTEDAREADLSEGTVFYLYTPFTGSVLQGVMESLRHTALTRPIRVCTFGPCTLAMTEHPWLRSISPPQPDHVTIFHSRR